MSNPNPGPEGTPSRKRFAGYDWGENRAAYLLGNLVMGVIAAPLLFGPAAISGNRSYIATVAGFWVLGQVAISLVLLIGVQPNHEDRPTGAASQWLVGALIVTVAPWIALAKAWPRLTTGGLCALIPLCAAFWVIVTLCATGEGHSPIDRIRSSPHRNGALILAGLSALVAVIVGLIMLIRATHPLA